MAVVMTFGFVCICLMIRNMIMYNVKAEVAQTTISNVCAFARLSNTIIVVTAPN